MFCFFVFLAPESGYAAFLVGGTAVNSRRITLHTGILSKPGNLNAGTKLPHLNPHCTQHGDQKMGW